MTKVGFVRIARVENFEKFKSVFEGAADLRKSYGSKGGYLYRNSEDHNQVFILLEWNSLENAKNYLQSDDIKQKMNEAGVCAGLSNGGIVYTFGQKWLIDEMQKNMELYEANYKQDFRYFGMEYI